MIDQLLPIVLQMLRAMNNGDSGTTSGENAGEIGATADTPISNNEAQCITDTIINNVSLIADSSIEIASAASSGGGGGDNTAITQIPVHPARRDAVPIDPTVCRTLVCSTVR